MNLHHYLDEACSLQQPPPFACRHTLLLELPGSRLLSGGRKALSGVLQLVRPVPVQLISRGLQSNAIAAYKLVISLPTCLLCKH